MSQETYIAGICNIGQSEIRNRKIVAIIGSVLSVISLVSLISVDAPRSARLGIFIPLLIAATGWVQSRRKFCLAFGFMGTFNFGKMGQVSRVADPVSLAADRKTALSILGQVILYAAIATAVVVALPL